MAYFLKQNEDNNQNNQTTQPQNVGGNVYSTSGGEVSSQIENNSNSSNSSNSNSSNSSGNWVNLNSYLDANQNKAGRYANTFVESDLNKGQDYNNNLQNAQDKYLSSIKNDTAYTYNKSKNNNPVYNLLGINATANDDAILDKYLKDSSSVTQNEKDRAMNILKGYQGDDYFQNTGNKYGYNDLKKTSDDFNNLSKNILNENYLKSQMGNNVSTGGKNLNSFILGGSNDSRNVLNNASNQFSELSSLLDSTNSNLNKERDNVVNVANKNSSDFNKLRQNKEKELIDLLQSNYDTEKSKYDWTNYVNKEVPLDDLAPQTDTTYTLPNGKTSRYWRFKVRDDLSKQAADQLSQEITELQNRSNSLLGDTALNDNSALDSNFKFFSDYREPTQDEISLQDMRNLRFSEIAGSPLDYDESVADSYGNGKYWNLLRAFMEGRIDEDQVKANLENLPRRR